MNVIIRGENIKVTPNLEDFTHDKVGKFERYMPQIEEIYVELSEQKSSRGPDIVSAQITVRHSRGAILRTEEKLDKVDSGTIQSAILAATDKMARRIRRFKDKPRSKRLRERYRITEQELKVAEPLPLDVEETLDNIPMEDDLEYVIRRKQVGITAMNEEEAIEQMELLGHTFFMFFNADENSINVVYKRRNSGYGILVPMIE